MNLAQSGRFVVHRRAIDKQNIQSRSNALLLLYRSRIDLLRHSERGGVKEAAMTANPSIERTATGKPVSAAHVKRWAP